MANKKWLTTIFGSYEGHKVRKKWMEALNLNLKFEQLESIQLWLPKEEELKFLISFLTLFCVEILYI